MASPIEVLSISNRGKADKCSAREKDGVEHNQKLEIVQQKLENSPKMLRFQVAATLLLLISSTIGQIITPFASPTASVCVSNCSVHASLGQSFGWEQITINTTIVAATVVTIINTNLKTSRITTIFNALPDGYELPPTNSDGTVTQRITYTRLGQTLTTDLAFPTEFDAYIDTYTWNGTLDANGTACLTANTPSIGSVTTFPPQPSVTFPTYESDNTTITNDTKGLYFMPVTDDIQLGDYITFYTDVPPLGNCTISSAIPVIPHWTAEFLTHTSVSYEGSGDVSTSSAAPALSPPPPFPPAPTPPTPPLSPPSIAPSPQPPVGQTSSQQPPPENLTPSSLSSPSSYQPPPTVQSTPPTTTTSEPSSSANGVLPAIPSLPSTLGLSSNEVVTSTGVTNSVSFTSTYTTIRPTISYLVTSNGALVAPLFGFIKPLTVMGLTILFCV